MLKHALYRAKFRARTWTGPGRFPVHVDLELAGKCQLACTMCPYGTGEWGTDRQGMMPYSLAVKALVQAQDGGASSVKLNFRGEPGLHPRLIDAVRLAKNLGFVEVSINTNLTAFSTRRLQALCDARLDLCIVSADGATANTYEAIRVGGDFHKLLARLEELHNYTPRPRIRVQMVVQEANRHEVELAKKVFGPLCDELQFHPIREGNQGGERKRCPQPFQRLVVAWNGEVYGCCNNWGVPHILGHFPGRSLADIWAGDAAKTLQRLAKHPERGSPCDTCQVSDSYK